MSENYRSRLSYREMFKSRTYVVPITFILQDSPDMMLTFSQLMDRLEEFVSERPKSFKSVIRNLLSSNPCFCKIPVSPEAKRNYWKLDHSKITEKMVRGNFKGILEWFPELTKVTKGMLTTPPPDHYTTLHSPEAAACKAVNSRCEVKFSSSFSIDSILKKDSPSGLGCKASLLSEESGGSVKVEQEPSWSTQRTVGLKMKFTWESSLIGDGAASRPTKRICMSPDSSNATLQERFNNCKTYLAMIAFVLQDYPENMLTFSQLMDRLEELGSGRTKSFESNIRVCLSTQACFFKIPAKSEAQWNFWKLDLSKITEKMVRRHFKGIQELFPELTTVRKEMLTPLLHSPEAAVCKAVNSRCEVNFSSSFSIDSILEKGGPSAWCYPLSEVSGVPW